MQREKIKIRPFMRASGRLHFYRLIALHMLSRPDQTLGAPGFAIKKSVTKVAEELKAELEMEKDKNGPYIEMLTQVYHFANTGHRGLGEIAADAFTPLSVEERILFDCEADMPSSHVLGNALMRMCDILSENQMSKENPSEGEKV